MANTKVTGDLIAAATITATNIASGGLDSILSGYLTTNTYATESYVTTAVANLVDAAPSTLDTLNELAAALGDDPNFATTVTNSLASKVDGTGTANYIPKFIDTDTIGNSAIYESSGNIGIGTTTITNGTAFGGSNQVNKLKVESAGFPCVQVNTTNALGGSLQFTSSDVTQALISFSLFNSDNALGILNKIAGPVVFYTNDTERMRITSGGNVGIGTNSPTSKLDVAGVTTVQRLTAADGGVNIVNIGQNTTAGGYSVVRMLGASNRTSWEIGQNAQVLNALSFTPSTALGGSTFSSPSMVIANNGNVGIGTNSPASKVDINNGAANSLLTLTTASFDGTYRAGINFQVNTFASTPSGQIALVGDNNYSGNMIFSTAFGGTTNSPVERMRITSAGNVGIGTSSPSTLLEIAANNTGVTTTNAAKNKLRLSDTDTVSTGGQPVGAIEFYSADTSDAGVNSRISGVCIFGGNNAGALTFETGVPSNLQESMRIDSSGNVGVGTSSPATYMHILGANTSGRGQLSIQSNNVSNAAKATWYYDTTLQGEIGTTSGDFYALAVNNFLFYAGGSEKMRITSAGAVGINNTNPPAQLTISASNNFQTNGTLVNITDAIDTRIGFYHYHSGAGFNSAMEMKYTARSQSSAFEFLRFASNAATDNEFRFRGDGQAYADGSWNGGGADYAEYFETLSGNAIDRGVSVVIDVDKVRPATESDDASKIIGIVRPKGSGNISSMVGNSAWNKWNKKYLTDDFGEYIREEHNVIEWVEIIVDEEGAESEKKHSYESYNVPEGVVIPEDATIKTHDEKGNKFDHRKLNPDYDESFEYIPREQRDEWVIVGLLGQVPMLKGQPVNPNWIKMKDISETVELWFIK